MKLNSLNLNIANNRGNQFQQPGSLAPVGQTGQSQSRPGDRTGLSREAQQAAGAQGMRGGSAQQLTQALSRDIGQVLQAQGSGDQNRSQQALQQLGQTYQQGQQSGQLQQVPPMVRQTAESLLGINQQGQGQAQQAGKGGGCSGGGEAGGGGQAGGPSESSGGGSAGDAAAQEDKKDFPEEILKKLEELLGKDKAKEAAEESKTDKSDKAEKGDKKDGNDAKTEKDGKDSKKVDKNRKPEKSKEGAGGKKATPVKAKTKPKKAAKVKKTKAA